MRKLLSALVLFTTASVWPQLNAGPVYPDCVAGTLQGYIDSSGCVLGEGSGGLIVFTGFAFPTPLNPDGITVLNASQIELTPQSSGLGGSFDFSGVGDIFSVPAGDTVTYDIDYFLLLDPETLTAESLFLDPSGEVSVTESICADSYFGTDSGATVCQSNSPGGVVDSAPQSLSVNDSNPPSSLSAEITLSPAAYSFASVEIAIVLTGGTTGASSGGVVVSDIADAPDPPAPEPVTFWLCSGGLTTIGFLRRCFTA